MGKVDGFLKWSRAEPHRRPIALRVLDWHEVEEVAAPTEVREQAGRCMDCGVPFCTSGFPLGNPIPDFADAVWTERWSDAIRWLATTNEFPEFTGRLCPAPCEAACVLAINEAPVTIEALERAIAERAFAEGAIVPRPPKTRTGRRVAIVGSGPAGLAAAAALNRAGHTAIVYEAAARAGGLLRYGIPDFKIEKHVIDRRLAVLAGEGIDIRCNASISDWARLRAEHDAVVIAIGAQRARELDVPGRALEGVLLAMDYLCDQNDAIALARPARFDVRGKRVLILGGGDTGSDCLGTALRQGAASVSQIELMPQAPAVRTPDNAWPAWPLVFRTSSSQEEAEAGEAMAPASSGRLRSREFAFRTTRLEGEHGRLVALHGVRVDAPAGGEQLRLPVDTLILALGFTGPDTSALVGQFGVKLDARGNVLIDERFATTVPGIYCAGDAHRGASLVVWAIAEGRDCAAQVDAYLRQKR